MTQEQISQKSLIKIVDDDGDVLSVFKNHLTNEGYNVHAFSDAEAAYEHFRYSPKDFSLMLSDIRMPRMNRFELTRKVKALNPEVKIILMTAFEINKSEAEKVLPSLRVDGFIEKPVSLNNISEVIRKQLVDA